jgi:arylsulfatase A
MKTALMLSVLAAILSANPTSAFSETGAPRPNIIVIFMDDMGYNDIGVQTYPSPANYYPNAGPAPDALSPYSDPQIPSPNQARLLTPTIDSLAEDGMRMTSFHTSCLCSPSRASMLTGRYDLRVDFPAVLFPDSTDGFSTQEVTVAEKLRELGYATGMIGKWHLGYNQNEPIPFQMMPTRNGFQEYYGLPYSNDMSPLPLIRNETIIDPDVTSATDQAELTWRYTETALDFIERNTLQDKPFFLYFAHSMTHLPCWPSDREFTNADGTIWPKFQGTSGMSYYYDVVKEVDHSVDRVLQELDNLGIADNTLVIFTSDNGPWLQYANWKDVTLTQDSVGSAYPLRDGKFYTYEGGVRVPFIARWPGKIAPGSVTDELGGLVDFLPTFVKLAGGSVPAGRTIDGVDLWPLWSGQTNSLSRYYAFYAGSTLSAVSKGTWKLREGVLYDLDTDIQETTDVSGVPANAAILNELQTEMTAIAADILADNEPRGDYTSYEVEFSTNDLSVAEGGTASFGIRLSANPGTPVSVNVVPYSGDTDLSVSAGGTLNFTTSNWSNWQTVTLAAAVDADAENSGATFRATMSGANVVREFFAFEADSEAPLPINPSLVWPKVHLVRLDASTVKLVAEGMAQLDGTNNPPGSVYAWNKVSGPGDVTFTNPDGPESGISFSTDGSYKIRFSADHPTAGGFGALDFAVDVGASGTSTGLKYSRPVAYDATQDLDGNAVWENLISPGTFDVALSSGVVPFISATSNQSTTIDFDPSGEFTAQFPGGGSYTENGTGGLEDSVGLNLANLNVATLTGSQEKSLLAGEFATGASVTVGSYFRLSSLGSNTGISGQVLRLGLSNGATDNFYDLPFGTVQLDNTTTGSASLIVREALSGSTAFTLAANQWYYFETTFTRGSGADIAYEMLIADASADGTVGTTLKTHSFTTASEVTSTELDKVIYAAFKGYDASAVGVIDNFSVTTALPSAPIDPAPSLSFIDSALDFPGGLTMEGGVTESLDAYSTGNASFEFWFKPNVLPTSSQEVLWETGGDIGSAFILNGSTLSFVVDDGSASVVNGASAAATLAPSAAQDGFIHAVGVIDLSNDQIRLYLDGSLADLQAIAGVADWCGTSGTGFGKINTAAVGTDGSADFDNLGGNDQLSLPIQAFAGWMAIARFYDQALSASAVAGLNTNPLAPEALGNISPEVSAGVDQSVSYVAGAALDGTLSDDGLPSGSSLSVKWRAIDGPGTAAFSNDTSVATAAGFDLPGIYRLWLEANDTQVKVYDETLITVAALTYAEWTSGIALPAGQGGADDNPDGDQWSNLWEWTLGLDPLVFNAQTPGVSQQVDIMANGNPRFVLEFDVPRNREPNLMLEGTTNLLSVWNPLPEAMLNITILDAETERWTFSLESDPDILPELFIRGLVQ